ncbi:response regulator transcription factor [Christensenellaceae bacterium OttesenSCG-928-K19]|nr:response regulator transcription factor [Christensenellaceae bacterium OttesenSCG-928-K19]
MRIILVDDDPVVTASLKTILEADGEIDVVGIGNNGNEAVHLYQAHQPDIALLDIQMGELSGLEAAKEILQQDPNAKVLFLTTFSDDDYIVSALRIGAKGYMLKQDFDKIVPAIKAVYAGQSVLGSEVITKLPTLMEHTNKKDLSRFGIEAKEEQIISLVAKGLSNKEIASIVYLGEGTVRNYISAILEKLGLRDRTQLAVFYYTSGAMPPPLGRR